MKIEGLDRFNKILQFTHALYLGGDKFFLVRIMCAFLSRVIRLYYHCDIPYTVELTGVSIMHKGFGIVIHPNAKIGENTIIQNSVIIGERKPWDVPIIGRNCFIGAGAFVIGKITIGDNVKIGAGAVVTTDVPEGCTAVGVPARLV